MDLLEVGVEEPVVEAVGDAVEGPAPRGLFERADQPATLVLADVERPLRVAQDRQLPFEPGDSGHGDGGEVLVQQGGDGQLDAGESADLTRPLSGGVDDHVGDDGRRPRLDRPGGAGTGQRPDGRVPQDPGAPPPRPVGEGMSEAGGVDPPVARQPAGGEHPVEAGEGPQLGDPVGTDDLEGLVRRAPLGRDQPDHLLGAAPRCEGGVEVGDEEAVGVLPAGRLGQIRSGGAHTGVPAGRPIRTRQMSGPAAR